MGTLAVEELIIIDQFVKAFDYLISSLYSVSAFVLLMSFIAVWFRLVLILRV